MGLVLDFKSARGVGVKTTILILVLLMPFAIAQETINLPNQLILPGSPLYNIDLSIDNFRIAITQGNINKIRVLNDIAQERLEESIIVTIQGKPELANQAITDGEEKTENLHVLLNTKLSTQEIVENLGVIDEIKTKLSQREETLNRIINTFKTDANPNNDHAITALERALSKTRSIRSSEEQIEQSVDDDLNKNNAPRLEEIRTAMNTAKANKQNIIVKQGGNV